MLTRPTASPARTTQANRSTRRSALRPVAAKRKVQRRRPRMSRLLAWLLSALLGSLGLVHAQVGVNTLPMGGRVVVGAGQVQQGSSTLVITQATPKLGMDWQSFNIGSNALVQFVQPGADSVALNRVLGNSGSEIYGRLQANGQVFLVNPSGILFAPGSKVDVGGLVASTLDLSQQDFSEGRYNFNTTGRSGSVVNQGELRATAGGYLALFGNRVDNQGTVQVDSGSVVLASGRAATVSISGSGLISAVVTPGDAGSVSNSGSLLADGGVVTMTAHSADGVARSLVNNTGIVRANTLVERNGEVWITGDDVANSGQVSARSEGAGAAGRIMLLADMQRGEAQVGGSLDASSAGGDGGFIETSAARVKVAADAQVTTAAANGRTGTWLIDPTDFTVAASGGDLTGAQLSSQLASNNINIATNPNGTGGNGDIFVNDTVSWASGSTLTLTADRSIAINSAMTASGSGRLALEYARSVSSGTYRINAPVTLSSATGSFTTKQGSNNAISYTALSASDLQNFDSTQSLTGNYMLVGSINLGGQAFNPIGNQATTAVSTANSFSGRFEGLGHTVSGLSVTAPTNGAGGLFASTTGSARISNLTLAGTVSGTGLYVGGLVGVAGGTQTLDNIKSTVDVSSTATGNTNVGGIAGRMTGGTLSNSSVGTLSSRATLSGGYAVGGVVGQNLTATLPDNTAQVNLSSGGLYAGGIAGSSTGAISNAAVGGSISSTASAFVGGVVGQITGASTTASVSSASVSSTVATSYVGGLAGESNNTISNSSASGAVSGGVRTGGLVGHFNGSLIDASFATGTVESSASAPSVGGLVGYVGVGSISNATASGNVTVTGTGGSDVGGLVGTFTASTGSVTNSSATGNVNGGQSVGGLIGTFTPSGSTGGNITNSFATGNVTATVTGGDVGGLIGLAQSSGSLSNSYARGSVSAPNAADTVGGLVGQFQMTGGASRVSSGSAATGNAVATTVTGGNYTGGVFGWTNNTSASTFTHNAADTSIAQFEFLGSAVSGNTWVGGLVGRSDSTASYSGLRSNVTVTTNRSTTSGAGGMAGYVAGAVSNAQATGSVGITANSAGTGQVYLGGLIGQASGSASYTISNSSATGTVTGNYTSTSGGGSVGGLIGQINVGANNVSVSSSSASGNVSGASTIGGLVGYADGAGSITSSSASGTVTGTNNNTGSAGGLVGEFRMSGGMNTVGASGTVSTAFNAGGLAGYTNTSGTIGDGVRGTSTVTASSVSGGAYVGGVIGRAEGTGTITGFTTSMPVAGGAVTSQQSVGGVVGRSLGLVSNSMSSSNVSGGANTDIGGLVGRSDGGGVSGSSASGTVTQTGSGASAGGLVGYLGGSSGISSSSASGAVLSTGTDAWVGGLVGGFQGTGGSISDSSATGSVTGGLNVGGLVGYFTPAGTTGGSVSNSFATGDVTTTRTGGDIGGLMGYAQSAGALTNSYARGNVSAPAGADTVGGLVGEFRMTGGISRVSAGAAAVGSTPATTVTGGNNTGGVIGWSNNASTTSFTHNAADTSLAQFEFLGSSVSGSNWVGGLVGVSSGTATFSGVRSSVTVTTNRTSTSGAGGVAGYVAGGVSNAQATGNVGIVANSTGTGQVYLGGLIGQAAGAASYTISNSTATGTVTGNYTATSGGGWVGGLIGQINVGANNVSISGSSASGNVSGASTIGGLVGYADGAGSITGSSASGTVTGTNNNTGSAGGLVGQFQMTGGMSTVNASGAVSTAFHAGGLAGYTSTTGTIGDTVRGTSAVTGSSVSGGVNVGGVIGYAIGTGTITGFTTSMPVTGGAVTSQQAVGGIAGRAVGLVSNSTSSSNVSGGANTNVGGLVGWSEGGGVSGSSASGTVTHTGNNSSVGGLVGYLNGSVGISNSSANGAVSTTGTDPWVGGLVGGFQGTGGSISGSSATGSVTGGLNVGGLVGYFNPAGSTAGNISNSFALGDVSTTRTGGDVGGLVGYAATAGALTNSYARGNVTAPNAADTVGGLVGQFQMTGGISRVSAGTAAVGSTPATTVTGGNYTGGVLGWTNNASTTSFTHNAADTSVAQFEFFGSGVSGNTWVGGLVGQSTGTATFSGVRSNVTVTTNRSTTSGAGGMAGFVAGAVSNAQATGSVGIVSNSTGTGQVYLGGLIGQAGGAASYTISNSTATGAVTGNYTSTSGGGFVGGLIGQINVGSNSVSVSVSGSSASGNVSGASTIGGLVGYADGAGSITGSSASGTVTGTNNNTGSAGGLVGQFQMTGGMNTVNASGAVSTAYHAGGLAGYTSTTGTIGDTVRGTSTVTGASVSGGVNVGGVIGYAASTGTITGFTTSMSVTSGAVTSPQNVGGVAGYSAGLVSNSSASGTITGSSNTNVGGLVGQSVAGVADSSATGTVVHTGTNSSVGGLVGYVSGGSVSGSSASVNVTSPDAVNVGGLIGAMNGSGSISGSQATGNVSGGTYSGGLVGQFSVSGSGGIATSQASGSVSGGSFTGGLVGSFSSSPSGGITNSQAGSTGSQVTGTTYTGGVVGYYTSTQALVTDSTAGTSVAFRGASVTGTTYAGGIVGYSTATAALTGLSSAATVSATTNAGGIAGRVAGNVTNVSATGNVSGGGSVGGAIGVLNGSGTVSGSQASGAVSNTTTGGDTGGLIGTASMSSGTIGTSSASGVVSGGSNAGGLVGEASSVAITVGTAFNGTTATVSTSTGTAGGVVGSLSSGTLSGAASQRPVTGVTAGGAVGLMSSSAVTNSSASAAVTGTTYGGGLVGRSTGTSSIADSTSSSNVTTNAGNGTTYVGGLLGYSDSVLTVSRTEATGNVLGVASSANAGGLIGYIYDYYWTTNSTAARFVDNTARGNVTVDASSGNVGGLVGYALYPSILRSNAYGTVLSQDSTNNTSSSYNTGGLVGNYQGTTNQGITSSNAYGRVTGTYFTGGLVGQYNSDAYITGSSARGDVTGTQYVGGLAGYFSGSTNGGISNSSATGNISGGAQYSGGLVGYFTGSNSLTNVSASGNVVAPAGNAGGLAGRIDGAGVATGFASGNVSGAANYAGGLVGYVQYFNSTITRGYTDSRATGNVTTTASNATAGGLLGYHYNYYGTSPVLNSSAEGNVSATGTGSTAGGLVGLYQRFTNTGNAEDIRGGFASGAVTASSFVGGLVGNFDGYKGIRLSGATGNVTLNALNNSTAGGLVGRFNGYTTGVIDRSWSSSNVGLATGISSSNFRTNYMGGLVGEVEGSSPAVVSVTDSYATGSVTANALVPGSSTTLRIGGLVGEAQQSVQRTYSTGAVSASGFTALTGGGLIGRRSATTVTVNDSFWATDASGQATSAGGTGQTLSELKQLATFPATGNTPWSIASTGGAGTTWRIYEGFTTPLLAELLTPASITLADTSKVYDGTTSFGNGLVTGSGGTLTRPDLVFINALSPNVGTYSVAAANIFSTQRGYDLSVTGSSQLTITQRPLTLAGVVADKVYDGTRVATLTGTGQPTGLVAGEDLRIDGSAVSAVFDTKDAGTNKSVTVTGYTLSDGTVGRAANYSIGANTLTTASITPKALTGLSFTATDRAYDGSTSVQVSVSGGALQGVIGNDQVAPAVGSAATGTMADKNVGSAKPVSVSGGALTGADAGNYAIGGTSGVTVNITQRDITVNGLTADNRAYNASTNVTVRTGSAVLNGLVSGDIVQLADTSFTGQLADKNVDTAKPVTVTGIRLRGPDALNYRAQAGGLTVDITRAVIGWFAFATTGTSRVYDGTANATVRTSLGSFGNDSVTLNVGQAVFVNSAGVADKNVVYNSSGNPTSKNIVVSNVSLSGSDAGNYTLQNASSTTSGVLSPISLSVTGVTAVDRVYDGTTSVAVSVANASVDLSRKIVGDDLGVTVPGGGTATGTMANKNVGTNKPVTNIPGFTLTGNDRLNYSLSGTNGVTVNITRKDLTASYTGLDRAYDGGTVAQVQASSTDIVAGDNVDFYSNIYRSFGCFYYCASYTGTGAKNVGQNKPISVTSDTLAGNDAANYNFINATTGTASASITPKPITAQFRGVNKVYDGTTDAQITLNTSASGVVSRDAVTVAGTGTFASKDVAYTSGGAVTTQSVNVTGISLSGNDAFNYTLLNSSGTTTARIDPKAVTLTGITPQNRSYDGTTTVAVTAGTVTSTGFVASDAGNVSVQQPVGGLTTGTIANKNVGNNKPVTVTGLSLAGSAAGNYSIDLAGSGLTVNIVGREITAVYSGVNKVYDGGTAAQVLGSSADILSTDTVGFSQSAIFTGIGARNVGTAKPISVSNITLTGADAANYTLLNRSASSSADITAKGINVTYVGLDRVYNGAADLSANVQGASNGLIAGDVVGFTQQALFQTDGRAGTGKAVDVSAIALTGANASNYSLLNTTASTTANVTRKPIGVTGISAIDRTYDGTTQVQISVGTAQVDTSTIIGADQVTVTLPSGGITTGTLRNGKNAGQAKAVDVSGLAITGADAANYQLVGATGLTVNIAPRQVNATFSALDKVYDGSAAAQVSGASADFLPIDSGLVSISATGNFADKNAGSGKTVAVNSAFLTGAERANYSLINSSGQTTASISRKPITPRYSGGTRVYDGGLSAPVTSTTTGIIVGDLLGFSQTAVFSGVDGKNVGTGKAVAVSNVFLLGADAANYQLTTDTASTTASVTPKSITVSGLTNVTAQDRSYDGTRVVTVVIPAGSNIVANSGDIVAGDNVSISVPSNGTTTGSMASKTVGNNKAVLVDGLGLSGTDSANYTITGTAGITVNISPKSLTANYLGVNRVYDGSTAATATGTSTDIVSGDNVTIRATGQFTGADARNAGTGKAVSVNSASLSGADAVNYSLVNSTGNTTADITPRSINPSFTGGSRVYDGSVTAPVNNGTGNFVSGDAVTLSATAEFTGSDAKNAGLNKPVLVSSISLSGADAANYRLTASTVNTTATITPKPLVLLGLSGLSAVNRVYDGSRDVTVNITSTGGIAINTADIVGTDDVSVNAPTGSSTAGTVANKNAGNGKTVTVTGLTLAGADAGNYSIAATNGLTVDIAPRSLTASYAALNKVYDGLAAATISGSSGDILSGDTLSIGATGLFTDGKNVGTGKTVAVSSGRLTGTDAANYTLLNTTGSTTANITPRELTATYTGGTRVYDGSLTATVAGTLGNLVANDRVVLGQTAVFTDSKNVGANKPVAVSALTLSGADAGNYQLLTTSANTTASLTPRPLRLIGLTGVSATNRVYDATTTVEVRVSSIGTVTADPSDLVAGDVVSVNAPATGTTTGTLLDKNVGTAKPVAVTGLSLSGTDAGNYTLQGTTGVTVDITPKLLTATYAAQDRVYDGSTAAAITASSADRLAGDNLSITAQGVFTGTGARNAGANKAVSVTGGVLSGADALNYSLLNPTGNTTATVVARNLNVSYLGGSRVYDATTSAPVTAALSGMVTGDEVLTTQSAAFTGAGAKNAGIGKAISVTGITLSGADAANYNLLTTSASTTGTITPRALTVSGLSGITALDRVYDGTLSVSLNVPGSLGSPSGDAIAGDQVSVVISSGGLGAGTLLDKNAGQGKSVVLSGLSLTGADQGNYFIAGTTGLTVNIARKSVNPLFTGVSRVYDGTAAATVLGGSSDVVAGDSVSIAGTGIFTGTGARNVGTGKTIEVTGANLTGSDAANYTLTSTTGTASADITPRTLTASYAGGSRVYDGTANAPVTRTLTGLVTGDQITVSETATFTGAGAKNVGSNKAVDVTGLTLSGADATNYSLTAGSLSTTASITPRPLTVSGLTGITAQDRIYDGTTAVAVNIPASLGSASGDVIAGDNVTVVLPGTGLSTASMLDKNAGQNKAVVLNGLSLAGPDAGNYAIAGTLGLTVNIAPRSLSISGVVATDRVYDGTTVVAVDTSAGTLAGAISTDDVRLLTSGVTGSMADKNVGQNKAVSVTGLALAGTDLVNYTVISGPGLTVNITPRTLTASAGPSNKVFDGTTGATVTLTTDQIAGDAVNASSASATYASRNAGSGIAVDVAGITLSGADAANYQLAATQLTTTGSIDRRTLTITPSSLSKIYGDTATLTNTAFVTGAGELVAGDTVATVSLLSAGAAAAAPVQGAQYSITASNASGGTFDPANYNITYGSGLLTVQARPVTVAANSRVLFAGDPLPALSTYGFSTSVGGLLAGDTLSSVTVAPVGLTGTTATAGQYVLQASGASFGLGSASNYDLTYATGLLWVLPPQPRVGDTSSGGGGGNGFAVTVTPQERADALNALLQAVQSTEGLRSLRNRTPTTLAPLVNALQNLTADELATLLSGDPRRLNVPDLSKMPLYTFDPELRRLMQTSEARPETTPAN